MRDMAEKTLGPMPGKKPAAGVAIVEPDGRVWIVDPAGGFGGYRHTFPKGKQEQGLSLQETAIKESFEESGLKVTITGLLGDFERDTSITRYYLARRTGGSPNEFHGETEAVRLVPVAELDDWLTNKNDRPVVEALKRKLGVPDRPASTEPHAMWVFLSNAFLSIVAIDGDPDTLKVRARFAGDIERVFPEAKVEAWTGTDYAYRAVVSRNRVADALAEAARTITATNFKASVREHWRHDAYADVWRVMYAVQSKRGARK
jgi:ADP-ribose pyrophosphatase YjhB (NUDIX family)